MPRDFKSILKAFRLRGGYGLRQFAELIGEAPSNYAGVESGQRAPWRAPEKLHKVASVLGLERGSADWDAFFIAAGDNVVLPPDMEHLLERPMVPVLLRTIDELRLNEDDLRKFVEYLRKKHGSKRDAT